MSKLKSRPNDELNRWKKFVDQFAHDMASPLSFLEQYVLHVSRGGKDIDEDGVDLHKVAQRSIGKLRDMLDNIRNRSKLDATAFYISDLAEMIGGVLSEIRETATNRGIDISYVGPDHLLGKFDRSKLERVLTNLCRNAIEAMPPAGGLITTSLSNNDDSVWIEIYDNGAGISPQSIDRIFERGYTYGKTNGTGLGLSFCKSVVEAHGGSLKVFSEKGHGTVFSLEFPVLAALKARHQPPGQENTDIEATLLYDNPLCHEELLKIFSDTHNEDAISIADSDFRSSRQTGHDNTLDPV
ncbi:MAG: HAMP domain-containing sensor histidine kinase [bacterium]